MALQKFLTAPSPTPIGLSLASVYQELEQVYPALCGWLASLGEPLISSTA